MSLKLVFNAKIVIVTLVVYLASCIAIEQASPEDKMEIRKAAEESASSKHNTTDEMESLNKEERDRFNLVNLLDEWRDQLKGPAHLPSAFTSYNPFSKDNLLATSDFSAYHTSLLKNKNLEESYDAMLTDMQHSVNNDFNLATILAKAVAVPETMEVALRLTARQFYQWTKERQSAEGIFLLLGLSKSKTLDELLDKPLFETWVNYVLSNRRAQFDADRARRFDDRTIHLLLEAGRLQRKEEVLKKQQLTVRWAIGKERFDEESTLLNNEKDTLQAKWEALNDFKEVDERTLAAISNFLKGKYKVTNYARFDKLRRSFAGLFRKVEP